MTYLKRIRCGSFNLDEAISLTDLENLSYEERLNKLIPPDMFFDYPKVVLSDFYTKLCVNGCEIYQKKINTHFALNENVLLYSNENAFLGIGKILNYENGEAIKLITRL